MDHPLDNPIWNSLATDHAELAIEGTRALRYHPEIAPFVGVEDETDLAGVAALIDLGTLSALFTRFPLLPIEGREWPASRLLDQMVAPGPVPVVPVTAPIEPLGDADVPEMIELVQLTRPGPFLARTIEMGRYFGIRDGGRLMAMAGERMRLPGHVEISAVCTHPDARGRGYARQLISMLARDVIEQGNVPFLHVLPENPAKALYRELGFVDRRSLHLYILGHLPL